MSRQRILITHNGRTQSASEWSMDTGIEYTTILARVRRGWPLHDVLSKTNPRMGRPKRTHCECGAPSDPACKDGSGYQCRRCFELNSKVMRWHDVSMKTVDVLERHPEWQDERAA